MTYAGWIGGEDAHHLDHLAPLCSLLGCPLLVVDENAFDCAERFYPKVECHLLDKRSAPEQIVMHFDTILYSTPRVLFEEEFFFAQKLHGKKLETIWCPHGNSDKGRTTPFMEALREEELLLVNGPRMEAFLRDKGVQAAAMCVGNYRHEYAQKHEAFYDPLVREALQLRGQKVVLYAPTWDDPEGNSSFPLLKDRIFDAIPDDVQLFVRLHPNLEKQFPGEVEEMKKARPDCFCTLPTIYPILDKVDLLITDVASSIGYDFLAFKRPMLLLSPFAKDHPNCQLAKEGMLLETKAFSWDQTKKCMHPKRSLLYEETFGKGDWDAIKKVLHEKTHSSN